MAENTRYRSLEEQLKKQENKLQELAETMAVLQTSGHDELQRKLHVEIEQSNSRLEAVVGTLDQKFSKMEQKLSTLLKVMMKEKGATDVDGGTTEPLLPTPPPHLRLTSPTKLPNHQPEYGARTHLPNLPRMEIPVFSSGNPREWLRKC